MYTQNNEEEIIGNYFGRKVGNVLSIGENDGKTFSNALALIEKGWGALLIEPSQKVWPKLVNLHKDNKRVYLANYAIGESHVKEAVLYDSGDFLIKGTCSLLSTLKPTEMKRWGNVQFEQAKCEMITVEQALEFAPYKIYHFISIDCEGYDWEILQQIDLDVLGCECIILEHNSVPRVVNLFENYVLPHGFQRIGYNQENIIFGRK